MDKLQLRLTDETVDVIVQALMFTCANTQDDGQRAQADAVLAWVVYRRTRRQLRQATAPLRARATARPARPGSRQRRSAVATAGGPRDES